MSEAPEHLLAIKLVGAKKATFLGGETSGPFGATDYTRTDLVRAQIESAVKRALEGAANEIDCGGCRGQCLDPANCHAKEADYIRALDPAQFVEGEK